MPGDVVCICQVHACWSPIDVSTRIRISCVFRIYITACIIKPFTVHLCTFIFCTHAKCIHGSTFITQVIIFTVVWMTVDVAILLCVYLYPVSEHNTGCRTWVSILYSVSIYTSLSCFFVCEFPSFSVFFFYLLNLFSGLYTPYQWCLINSHVDIILLSHRMRILCTEKAAFFTSRMIFF